MLVTYVDIAQWLVLSFITHPVQGRILPCAGSFTFLLDKFLLFNATANIIDADQPADPWSLISVFGFLSNFSINTFSYYNERFLEGKLRIFNAYSFESYSQLALLESAKDGTNSQCAGNDGLLVRLHAEQTNYSVQNTSVIVPFGGCKLSLRTSV